MDFDIKAKIEELAKAIQSNPDMTRSFQKDPVKTIEKLVGVDLPDDKLQPLITGIKVKLTASDIGGKLDGLKKFL